MGKAINHVVAATLHTIVLAGTIRGVGNIADEILTEPFMQGRVVSGEGARDFALDTVNRYMPPLTMMLATDHRKFHSLDDEGLPALLTGGFVSALIRRMTKK